MVAHRNAVRFLSSFCCCCSCRAPDRIEGRSWRGMSASGKLLGSIALKWLRPTRRLEHRRLGNHPALCSRACEPGADREHWTPHNAEHVVCAALQFIHRTFFRFLILSRFLARTREKARQNKVPGSSWMYLESLRSLSSRSSSIVRGKVWN